MGWRQYSPPAGGVNRQGARYVYGDGCRVVAATVEVGGRQCGGGMDQRRNTMRGNADDREVSLEGGGRTAVSRRGHVVLREAGPWTPTVHTLLRHLERVGFCGAPRVVGSGFDAQGREKLGYIPGEFMQPGPWTLEGAAGVGRLLRALHDAAASYRPPADAVWRPWFGRALGDEALIIGHGDAAPWNIVAREGLPVALIDWEVAGPVDPLVDLAQACWLNAKLHDEQVAEMEGLPPAAERARQLRAIVDGYGLTAAQRHGFLDRIIEFAVHDTAEQAIEVNVQPDSPGPGPLWGLAWRARSVAWMLRHRRLLKNALT